MTGTIFPKLEVGTPDLASRWYFLAWSSGNLSQKPLPAPGPEGAVTGAWTTSDPETDPVPPTQHPPRLRRSLEEDGFCSGKLATRSHLPAYRARLVFTGKRKLLINGV